MNKSFLLFFLLINPRVQSSAQSLSTGQSSPSSQSLTSAQHHLLDSLTLAIGNNEYTGIHSVLISKSGQRVYEHYFNGWQKDSLHDCRSSFKSITSLLTGIAIDKGFIKNVNQKVYSFFPEYTEYQQSVEADRRKKEMTIRNLLEMESGLDCEEFNGDKDCESEMVNARDWVRFSLDLPMKNTPGEVWAYTSCNPVIVGGIISHAAGMSIIDFANKYLFDPLGIRDYRWTLDSVGQPTTAGSFFMKPSDMGKIGELIRLNGKWNGRRIVSETWLKESTHATIPIPDFSFAKLSRSAIVLPQPAYYGYYWYSEVIKTKDRQSTVLFASGNGGQYIMIVKELDLVVVFTQGNYNSWKAKRAFALLARYILPAFPPASASLF